jgi:hypothetical protein
MKVGAVHPAPTFFPQAFKKGPFHSQKSGLGYMKQLSSRTARTNSDSCGVQVMARYDEGNSAPIQMVCEFC